MNATADLRAEHRGVDRMLDVLDVMSRRARDNRQLEIDDLLQVVEFLRVFVDKCHHHKEELLLFPALERAGTVSEIVDTLLLDHVQGRNTVDRIAAATERMADGQEAGRDLARALADYVELLQAHIAREEHDCFDVADRTLPPASQDELAAGYERVEREVIGEGRHEAFHALLDRLSAEYLG